MFRRRRYSDYHGYRSWYPKSTPRQAKGGIKAQSKRGTFGESWWAKRWIALLESFQIGARLGRGRSYARRGQVLSIEVGKGTVKAKVQGSRPTPYQVMIKVETLSKTEWQKLAASLSKQAIFAAKLLAGEMPQDIEDAFAKAKLSLFPEKLRDLQTDCSCPDWSNPCKHIAAVYYLLGEEFDRDPFLIFRLRGIERKELVDLMGGEAAAPAEAKHKRRAAKGAAEPAGPSEPAPPADAAAAGAEPLPCDPAVFWGQGRVGDDFFGEVRIPLVAAALPKRLGSLSFWRAETSFLEAMEAIYRDASPLGMESFLKGLVLFQET